MLLFLAHTKKEYFETLQYVLNIFAIIFDGERFRREDVLAAKDFKVKNVNANQL